MSAFTEANKSAFDRLAADYNSKPWQVKISQQVGDALRQRKNWLGAQWIDPTESEGAREVKLLDYACGTGSVTNALGGHVNKIRGVDLSENMVSRFNEAARSSGLSAERTNAVVGDMLASNPSGDWSAPEWYNFDVAAVGLGFHHFEDPVLATKRLAERLKPGTGVLIIVDFMPFEHNHGGHGGANMGEMEHTIKHSGFTAEGLRTVFEGAGLVDFGFEVLPEQAVMELQGETKRRTIFIAKGRRAPTAWGKLKNWVGGIQDAVSRQPLMGSDQRSENSFAPRKDGE